MTTVYRYKPEDVETSSGYWGGNTLRVIGDLCYQLYVKAASSGTVFDVTVTDPDSIVVRKFTNVVGVLNDLTPFPMSGVNTVEIDNSTADETFTVLLCCLEQ